MEYANEGDLQVIISLFRIVSKKPSLLNQEYQKNKFGKLPIMFLKV